MAENSQDEMHSELEICPNSDYFLEATDIFQTIEDATKANTEKKRQGKAGDRILFQKRSNIRNAKNNNIKNEMEIRRWRIHLLDNRNNNALTITVNVGNKRKKTTYHGILDIYQCKDGYLLVNELPKESYLKDVVPSEMPSSYPLEALKAQAVCARNYIEKRENQYAYQETLCQVDDTTKFQVFAKQERTKKTDLAVKMTEGMVLMRQNEIIDTLYFSTSCGMTAADETGSLYSKRVGKEKWKKLSNERNFRHYIRTVYKSDYEAAEPYYRWSLKFEPDKTITNIEVTKRQDSGRVEEIMIVRGKRLKKEKEIISGELKIRSFIGNIEGVLKLNDGTHVKYDKIIPSAFFSITKKGKEYILYGGGFGHGMGMSQNGAKRMALEGYNYLDILQFFYKYADPEVVTE